MPSYSADNRILTHISLIMMHFKPPFALICPILVLIIAHIQLILPHFMVLLARYARSQHHNVHQNDPNVSSIGVLQGKMRVQMHL